MLCESVYVDFLYCVSVATLIKLVFSRDFDVCCLIVVDLFLLSFLILCALVFKKIGNMLLKQWEITPITIRFAETGVKSVAINNTNQCTSF